jgi:type III pantothenate kinase
MAGGGPRWLLIGNSRWHWAEGHGSSRRYWSEPPQARISAEPDRWAAVGAVPGGLDPGSRLSLDQVPLLGAPPWLGVDRALAGHGAWLRAGGPVLVADAGTVLSLTWVDGDGRFRGGRLMAGAALQWRAMHQGTLGLPAVRDWIPPQHAGQEWPQPTQAAMVQGVLEGLAGALQRGATQLRRRQPGLRCWLTGGDGSSLCHLLNSDPATEPGQHWQWAEGLCLDTLASLAAISSERDP